MIKKKILIVDDEIDLVNLVKERLQYHGYEVIYLNSGRDAVQTTIEQKPDLLILDVMMPDKHGYDICYELKHNPETEAIPIIIFSAKKEWKKHMDEMSAYVKADDFIAKPFNSEDLITKIKNALKE